MIDHAVMSPNRGIVTLTMPKFKIEYEFKNLPALLSELGVTKMFLMDECDLGNMFPEVRLSLPAADRGCFVEQNSEF